MLKDQKDLLLALNAHGVRYLVVGGHAVGFHAEPRGTKDLDVWIESSFENSEAVYDALGYYGAPLSGLTSADFRGAPKAIFQIGVDPVRVDLLQSIEGVTWDEAWKNKVDRYIDRALPVHVISSDDLITNKLAAGRDVDLVDVRKIREARGAATHQRLITLDAEGWLSGFDKVACTKAVRLFTGLDLSDCKAITDQIVNGQSARFKVPESRVQEAIDQLRSLGMRSVKQAPDLE